MKINIDGNNEELYQQIYDKLDQTLSQKQIDELIRELEEYRREFKLEEYQREFKMQKKECLEWEAILFYLYFVQERPYEACQMISECKLDLDAMMSELQTVQPPKALADRGIGRGVSLFGQLYVQMLESEFSYDDYYEIFEEYPSAEYAQLLILYARKEDRRTDTIVLSNFMKKWVRQKQWQTNSRAYYCREYHLKPEVIMLSYYTERLEDLSYVKDYKEIRKCVNEAKREYDYRREWVLKNSPEWLPRFWIHMMRCLNILERYDRTVELGGTIGIKMTDPDYYLYLAEAYFAENQIEEARKNCKRSVALDANQDNLLLLSQIMFSQCEYKAAEKLLLQTIGMLSEKVKGHYIASDGLTYGEGIVERELHKNDFQKKLESPYTLLFLCYVYEGEYAKAKAFYDEISTKLAGSDMAMISGSLLHVNEKALGKVDEIRQQQEELRRQLEEASRENQAQRQLMRQWTSILAECQLEDEGQEVSTEYWEEQLAERMESSIREISSIVKKANEDGYQAAADRVKRTFPGLPDEAGKFLTSAEQMYQVFQDNEVIDFAPVMVEYCKVVEVLLWSYLDRTGEYDREIANNKKKGKTLGSAQYVIEQAGKRKSLFRFLDGIAMVTRFRNKSAHKEVLKKEPDLREVQTLIWETGLLQKLCS